MGFTPQQIDRMSVFQYLAALDGFVEAHGGDKANALSGDEADDLWQWLQAKGP